MPRQTGPRTPEGKAKSSRNAIKHGLASNHMFVLANENEEKWNFILKVWTDQLQPRNDAEFMIVTDIAHAQWRIRRARTIESGMMDLEMEDQFDDMAAIFKPPVDEGTRTACAFKGLSDKSRGLDHLHRYETRARRAFKSGLAALEQFRRLTAPPVEVHAPVPQPPAPAPEPEGAARRMEPINPSKPVSIRAKRPAAQQVTPECERLQNEMPARRHARVSLGRKLAIRSARDRFGSKISLHRREKHG